MVRIDVLTLFPHFFETILGDSIIGRAQKSGLIEINAVNIRDFSKDKHKKTDDYPYGGGNGMVMTPQPIYDAYLHVAGNKGSKPKTVYMTPQGKLLNQEISKSLSQESHIIILCGHYEGVDERIIEKIVDEEISIGDYVLTGGELPAMVLIDCMARMVPGVLASEASCSDESIYSGLLEYPQYTRPQDFDGQAVPEILLSGHYANICKWRLEKSLERTKERRPDLYALYEKNNIYNTNNI